MNKQHQVITHWWTYSTSNEEGYYFNGRAYTIHMAREYYFVDLLSY